MAVVGYVENRDDIRANSRLFEALKANPQVGLGLRQSFWTLGLGIIRSVCLLTLAAMMTGIRHLDPW